MKYLLVYIGVEGEYLIKSSNDEKEISMEYFYYCYRGIRGLQVLRTVPYQLPEVK